MSHTEYVADSLTIKDDRTNEERGTHTLAIVARDSAMSFWGAAKHGHSRCAWAFDPSKVDPLRVLAWVKNRKEMKYANIVRVNDYRCPRGTAHFRIYTCDDSHPAAQR